MIPRRIHQIWLGSQPPLHIQRCMDTVKALHPGWEYRLWTDENIPDFGGNFQGLASRSNYLRLLFVNSHGGIYLDTDVECLKPLDVLTGYDAFSCRQADGLLCNAAFGASAHHPWVHWQIVRSQLFTRWDAGWGPKLMTMAPTDGRVTVAPTPWFYPFSWDTPEPERRALPESLAIHHWEKSWLRC